MPVVPPVPLLIFSDSPSCSSGFGRITRELALRIHADLPEFRVACAGYRGVGSRSLPFPEYHCTPVGDWMPRELPDIVADFAGTDEAGTCNPVVIIAIWDASRLGWLADPSGIPDTRLRQWLTNAAISRWIYHPLDSEGPRGGIGSLRLDVLEKFDRVLAYTEFGARISGYPDHLPHGIDTAMFAPRGRQEARSELCKWFSGLTPESLLLGVVATNQGRKDWRLAFDTAQLLLERGHDVRMWAQTDATVGWWDMPRLLKDYGIEGRVSMTTFQLSDPQMSWMYSACDVTLGIGLGEGFGYGSFESAACGTPHVAPNYAGGAEFMGDKNSFALIEPDGYYWEGPGCCKRPVMNAVLYAAGVERLAGGNAVLPAELDWVNVWPRWKKWLREGL